MAASDQRAISPKLPLAFAGASTEEYLVGSGFGFFNLATGGAMLVASVLAGALWSAVGPAATFLTGAGFALVAGILLPLAKR